MFEDYKDLYKSCW